ncbi:hypothetical protein OIU77_018980 [Salix suchowensis]|uniref:Late embryogenesis abundant protein LEA-2 subgroup domain-containing protein n=1 Tax=Salix suchowensis TaxID=1278906 RepID=A0ABQ9CEM3_9ROSI|nr:hypothetical protein OIU77_018980 [Salix suchowensis]
MEAPKVEVAHITKKKSNHLYLILGGGGFLIILGMAITFYLGIFPLPHKPQFNLNEATISGLRFSDPNLLTCNVQVTISAKNPNINYGIFIENLEARAFYQNQQVTVAAELPAATYVGPKTVTVWPPFLYGNDVSVPPHEAANLMVDLNAGNLPLHIKVDGSLKWKVSSFTFGRYRLMVNCLADIPLGSMANGTSFESGAKTYLDHREVSVFSPVLYGKDVPVSPLVAAGLMEDLKKSGCVSLDIKVNYGRLQWKLGSSMIGKYQLIANCPTHIPLGNPGKMESAVEYESVQPCEVKS